MSSALPAFAVPASHRSDVPLTIDVIDGMDAVAEEWRSLQAESRNSLHQGFDWCKAWVDTHRHPLAILRGRRGGETVFLLPLEIQRHNMVRSAQFIASRFTNINTGLFSSSAWNGETSFTAEELSQAITGALTGQADLVSLGNIPFDWRGSRHPLASIAATEHLNHSFQLPLSPDFDATINQLNGKRRRKKFRNQVRKIEATGSFEHVIATGEIERHELLGLFFQQKAIRFKALGLPNVFHALETQAFFHELVHGGGSREDMPLELHALRFHGEHQGAIGAIAGLSRKGDHVICQFGSIDETVLPEASPGELLFWMMIERACREGAAVFDFGLGDQGYKRSWCTEETVQHDILLPISAVGRMAAFAQRGVNKGKAAIKGNPHLYALIQRLRSQADDRPAPERED